MIIECILYIGSVFVEDDDEAGEAGMPRVMLILRIETFRLKLRDAFRPSVKVSSH